MSQNTFKRHIDLLLIGQEGENHYVLIKDLMIDCFKNNGLK